MITQALRVHGGPGRDRERGEVVQLGVQTRDVVEEADVQRGVEGRVDVPDCRGEREVADWLFP